jgi:AcrR family transcriptional regulator
MRSLVDPADDPAVDDGHRRGRILRALASCVAEKGRQATTISDIAREARVSKTVVYARSRDKEHCLLELCSRADDKVLAGCTPASGLPGEARRRPRRGLGGARRGAGGRPALARVERDGAEQFPDDAELAAATVTLLEWRRWAQRNWSRAPSSPLRRWSGRARSGAVSSSRVVLAEL